MYGGFKKKINYKTKGFVLCYLIEKYVEDGFTYFICMKGDSINTYNKK